MKEAGVLCPISCLPTSYGIGDFGLSAYHFVDLLKKSHVHLWQILPLHPLAYGNSPYQPYSSFAGEEIYIDLEDLVHQGLLTQEDFEPLTLTRGKVDYELIRDYKNTLLHIAFKRLDSTNFLEEFEKKQSWLRGYCIYRVFKQHQDDKVWNTWESEYKNYLKKEAFPITLFENDIKYHEFLQYLFYTQWMKLKTYANERGIQIIGDMPIYVGYDSSDVWLNQENFLLEEDGTPSFVAGVPPDYFSKYGQRWGNPIYDWKYMESDGFTFWTQRLGYALHLYDIVRIDHFRAFDTYWKIPADEPTAIIGTWEEAPGYELFDTIFKIHKNAPILAEDLGELRDEVYELRDHYHMPGMYVYQFHHHDKFDMKKVVVYTGTHDNDTLVNWYETLDEKQKKVIDKQLEDYKEKEAYQKVIHYCLDTESEKVIVPVWDLMGLPGTCRFNTPGTTKGNWEWRLDDDVMLKESLHFYKILIKQTKRG